MASLANPQIRTENRPTVKILDPSRRRMVHGPLRPMEEPHGLLWRLLHR